MLIEHRKEIFKSWGYKKGKYSSINTHRDYGPAVFSFDLFETTGKPDVQAAYWRKGESYREDSEIQDTNEEGWSLYTPDFRILTNDDYNFTASDFYICLHKLMRARVQGPLPKKSRKKRK
jgi:hypothetical protein